MPTILPRPSLIFGVVVAAMLVGPFAPLQAGAKGLAAVHQRLELPGVPAEFIPTDIDADGRQDLLVVLAYTERGSISDDRFEDMMQITTVIPAILTRRELRAYLGGPDGALTHAATMELSDSVVSVAAGSEGIPALALTAGGVSQVRWTQDDTPALRLEPWIEEATLFAGSRNYIPQLRWIHDLDGDGDLDVLLPAAKGPAVFLAGDETLARSPAQRLRFEADRTTHANGVRRNYPWPTVRDLNGDDRPDLLVNGRHVEVLYGNGDGTFSPLYQDGACPPDRSALKQRRADGPPQAVGALNYFGDLDGDGRPEAVTVRPLSREGGMRAGLKDAKRPRQQFRIYRMDDEGLLEQEPFTEMIVEGHTFGDVEESPIQQFVDLDDDGRLDLITVTLDFSMFQMIKVMATQRIAIEFNFHVWRQDDRGRFHEVPDLDLSEKLKFNLNNFQVEKFAQFAGDFDGDGRVDFVHLGRGKNVTIHAGAEGCAYPANPDLKLELDAPLQDLSLVRVEDFNGDGRADLVTTRLLPNEDEAVSAAALVDLYFIGGSR